MYSIWVSSWKWGQDELFSLFIKKSQKNVHQSRKCERIFSIFDSVLLYTYINASVTFGIIIQNDFAVIAFTSKYINMCLCMCTCMCACMCHIYSNIGPSLIQWIKLFYNDILTRVSNNGWVIVYPSRSSRQRCPISLYIVFICAAILAYMLRNNYINTI